MRDWLVDHIEGVLTVVGGILIMGFLLTVAIGGAHQKQKECEQAGGTWLVRSQQCLPKENK